jgi:hypothetical protein
MYQNKVNLIGFIGGDADMSAGLKIDHIAPR